MSRAQNNEQVWINWMQHFGWHKPSANDLKPSPQLFPIDQPIQWEKLK